MKEFRKVRWRNGEWHVTCEELLEFLGDYLAGELDEPKRAEFERHLEGCSSCRAYLDSYRQTIALARGSAIAAGELDELPAELVAAVLAARD